jgi:hypothetical protein
VIYSVVNCKAEGVRRDSLVLGCRVCNKSDCQSNTRLSHLTRDNIYFAFCRIKLKEGQITVYLFNCKVI